MSRKNRSPLEDILEVLTLCPWYVSVIISVLFYVILRYYLPTIQSDAVFAKAMIMVIPQFAWIFALFLLVPAPISAIKAYQKKALLNNQKNLSTIRDLNWKDFEFMVAQAYRQQGYRVVENENKGPDDGIDVLIEKEGNRYVVQCKQWRKNKVGVSIVREMFGVMHAVNAHGVIIVTVGMFTQEARNFAHDKPIDLVEGKALAALVKIAQTPKPGAKSIEPEPEPEPESVEKPAKAPFDITKVKCPYCGAPLIKRAARRGPNAGKEFIGCTAFPKCKFTRQA